MLPMITLSQKNHFIKAIKISLLLIALNWVNFAYAQDIKRIRITHNGGADYSLGHLFLFNGATQYLTDYTSTISAGSNDFTFDYTVSKKQDNHGHIENLVRQGNSTNQKLWDGGDFNSTTWWSSTSTYLPAVLVPVDIHVDEL